MRGNENPGYIQAMRELRRSSAASPHVNKARQAKRGVGKGGRRAWKSAKESLYIKG